MSYTIYKSDGTQVVVDDNAIDTAYYNSTGGGGVLAGQGVGTQLIGRNTIDYGAAIAQNFLQMTENFSSAAAYFPVDGIALQGQLWFNKTVGALFVNTTGATSGGITNWSQIATLDSSGNFLGNATSATNLNGGIAYDIPYQSGTNTTAFLPPTAGVLQEAYVAGSPAAPTWTLSPTIFGTNISGLASGLSIGGLAATSSAVLVTPTSANTNYPMAMVISDSLPEQGIYVDNDASITWNPSTNILIVGSQQPSFIQGSPGNPLSITATLTGTATGLNIAGSVAGSILYQTSVNTTSAVAPGTDGYVLTMAGGVPNWAVGGGGGGGGGAYTAGAGISFTGTPPAAQAINNTGIIGVTAGANISITYPVDSNHATIALTGTVPSANLATNATQSSNIIGGVAGSVPYQTSASTTAMLAPGANGNVLTMSGGLPTWLTSSGGGVTSLTAGANIALSGSTGAVTVSVTGTVPNAGFATNAGTASNSGALGGQGIGYFQPALGFTPIQQGGGASQLNDKIYIGWASPGVLNLQVDSTNFGDNWPINITGTAANASALNGIAASSYSPWGTTWTLPSRAMNTWYQNTTGKTIYVQITLRCNSDQTGANLLLGGSPSSYFTVCLGTTKGADYFIVGAPVPNGLYYYCQNNGTMPTVTIWAELV